MSDPCILRIRRPFVLACACLVVFYPGIGVGDEASSSSRMTTLPEPIQFGFKPVEPGASFRATEPDSQHWAPSTETSAQGLSPSSIRPLEPPVLPTPSRGGGPPGRAEPLPNRVTVGRTPHAARAGALAGDQGPPRGYSQPRAGR